MLVVHMLLWLAFLWLANTASTMDTINCPALNAYIGKCEAVNGILNVAMIYANVGTNCKVKFEKMVSLNKIQTYDSNDS